MTLKNFLERNPYVLAILFATVLFTFGFIPVLNSFYGFIVLPPIVYDLVLAVLFVIGAYGSFLRRRARRKKASIPPKETIH